MLARVYVLTVIVIVGCSGASRADDLHRLLSWRMCWPHCIQKTCCDDYCPKPPPCVKPICCFGCDDYCPKCQPCVKRICCLGCDDYCPKCPPAICCAPCQDLKCVPTGCARCGCSGAASPATVQVAPSGAARAVAPQAAAAADRARAGNASR